jgi:hypothetical protein
MSPRRSQYSLFIAWCSGGDADNRQYPLLVPAVRMAQYSETPPTLSIS